MAGISVSPPQWKRRRGIIPAGNSKVIFEYPVSDLRSVKIIASFFNVTQDKTKQIEVGIINSEGAISDQVNKLGSALNLAVVSSENGGNLQVTATNNEIFELKYNLIFVVFRANF